MYMIVVTPCLATTVRASVCYQHGHLDATFYVCSVPLHHPPNGWAESWSGGCHMDEDLAVWFR